MPRSLSFGLMSVSILFSIIAIGQTDDAPKKGGDEKISAQRLELMQTRIASVKVTSSEEGFPTEFTAKPVFRYTDPARGYVAAAVWKLGDKGRPRALITTELYRLFFGKPRIVYEHLSLTKTPFSAMGGDIRWAPEGTAFEFKPIPGAEAPEKTPQRRLLQMRAIAKRFAGDEVVRNERCELRLLPQPVDRYTPSATENADGGMFLLTYGTNPEAVLLIESDGMAWNFAAGRLSGSSKLVLTIDGETAWEGPPHKYGLNQPYTASNAIADIPGIAPDGSEIKN